MDGNATTTRNDEMYFRTNNFGQLLYVKRGEEHLRHINVCWYLAGMWEAGVTSVQPGETDEQAAVRRFGHYARKTPFSISEVVWSTRP